MRRRLRPGGPHGVCVAAGVTGVVLLFATACTGSEASEGGVTVGGKGEAGAPQVSVSPGDGTGKARPEKGVVITATNGTLEQISLTAKGRTAKVTGELSTDRRTWRSRTLRPGASYQVSAIAKNPDGKTTTVTSAFSTLKAANTLAVSDVTPANGETVGVGMPITVSFNRPVTDRKAVERALTVKSTKPAVGAWYWVSNQQVIFRTQNGKYWRPDQKVAVVARLTGVRAAAGTYGMTDFTRKFKIGDAHVSVINTRTKQMVVKVNGKVRKKTGVSTGKGGRVVGGVDTYLTTNGVHLTMSKHLVETMTSAWMGVDPKDTKNGGYEEKIPYAVRISSSGEYVHSMASRMWAMGRVNASHGCVNSPPTFAQWFYKLSYRGDVVTVTGSKRQLAWNNGWSYYQMPWKQWVKGSALKSTVTTG